MAEQKTILVVDDEAHILHVVRLKLSNAGYEILLARDGEEGYEMASDHHPDLIITDFQMPFMTGLEMCERLQKSPETACIPVLLLTARGYALSEEDLHSNNILESISKPFSPRELLSKVDEVLEHLKPEYRRESAA